MANLSASWGLLSLTCDREVIMHPLWGCRISKGVCLYCTRHMLIIHQILGFASCFLVLSPLTKEREGILLEPEGGGLLNNQVQRTKERERWRESPRAGRGASTYRRA